MLHDAHHAMSNVCSRLQDVCLVMTAEGRPNGASLQKTTPGIQQPCFVAPAASHAQPSVDLTHIVIGCGLDSHRDCMLVWHTAAVSATHTIPTSNKVQTSWDLTTRWHMSQH